MSTPQDLTPLFNSIPIEEKIYPLVLEKIIIELDGLVSNSVILPIDICSIRLINDSDSIVYFNVSYTDGTNASPGDLTDDTSNSKVHEIPAGGSFDFVQEEKFNTIFALASTETDLKGYPGKGYFNGLPA